MRYLKIIVAFLFIFIFRHWLLKINIPIVSGDLNYFFKENLVNYFRFPPAWETFRNGGLGGRTFFFLAPYYYLIPMGFLGKFLSFAIVERIIWFFPALIFSFIGPFYLYKKIFKNNNYAFFSSLIYGLNSYFLMIVSGGQTSVFLAYSFLPFAFLLFLLAYEKSKVDYIIFFSLAFSLMIIFDLRFAYLLLFIIFSFFLFNIFVNIRQSKKTVIKFLKIFAFVFMIAFFIHSFWIVPILISGSTGVDISNQVYTSKEALKFFSFADLSSSLSLFHPNWYENIFGKISMINPLFIVFPLLIFSSLLFINKQRQVKKMVLFFACLAIVGIFFSKGINEPFGKIYLFLFKYIPGMNMFRDPTKFYSLICLGYSMLIPWTIYNLDRRMGKKNVLNAGVVFISIFIIILMPAIKGNIKKSLILSSVSNDYVKFKDFIISKDASFRTFWLPSTQRFTYYDDEHPVMSADFWTIDDYCEDPFCSLKISNLDKEYFQCPENEHCYPADFSYLANKEVLKIFQELNVKYLIVPFDTEGEIFVKERQYDEQARQKLINFITQTGFYKPIEGFEKLKVFSLENPPRGLFWTDSNSNLSFQMVNSTKYIVKINNKEPVDLVFSESFDENWEAKINDKIIRSKERNKLNSFFIEQIGNNEIVIEYKLQKIINILFLISMLTVFITTVYILKTRLHLKSK